MMNRIIIFLCMITLLSSCATRTNEANVPTDSHSIPMKYARHFSVDETSDGYLLHLKGGATYHLVRNGCPSSADIGDSSICIPIKKIASLSGTHLEFFRELDSLRSIACTCDSDFIYSPFVKEKIRRGEITTLGNSMHIDVEKLLSQKPDLLLLSDESELPSISCCPQIVCQEWKEESVLARAEWIKFFSLFTDQLELADSLFDETISRYDTLKAVACKATERPSIFAASCFGDTWYLTGGSGYMSQLYKDANADFVLSDTSAATVICGLEWVIDRMKEVDYWMNCEAYYVNELDQRLGALRSFQSHHLYNFNKRSVTSGNYPISDFFESGVAHPDQLLADVIITLHPSLQGNELLPQHTIYTDSVRFK